MKRVIAGLIIILLSGCAINDKPAYDRSFLYDPNMTIEEKQIEWWKMRKYEGKIEGERVERFERTERY